MEEVGKYFVHFDLFYCRLLYFVAVCYILWLFVIFCGRLLYIFYGYLVYFSVLVCCTKKTLANPGPM
jgi:hypothetical protein